MSALQGFKKQDCIASEVVVSTLQKPSQQLLIFVCDRKVSVKAAAASGLIVTNYQLPNGPVKAGRRWGQRRPQGANLGSNGILKFLSKTDTMAATSPP